MAVVQACKEWRVRPSDLGMCEPEDDLAYMVALVQVEGKMAAWEVQDAERRAKAEARK